MSKIYEALQVAYGKSREIVPDSANYHSAEPQSLVAMENPFSIQKFHGESELLGLAQNIATLLPDPHKNVIQFIGSRKGEGTSTLVREFAMVCARFGHKPVLLVEADFMEPTQHQAFGLQAKPPLNQGLMEGSALDGVISQVERSNLFLANLSHKSQSALTSRTFFHPSDMWKMVREQFSLILIDSSPATHTMDGLALCEMVDGIVLVLEAEKTRAVVAESVKNQILMRDGNLLGLVFNRRKFHIPTSIYKWL